MALNLIPQEIEIGLSDECNFNCTSCPHSIPKWKQEHGTVKMSVETAALLSKQLEKYKGKISFCGHGEPLTNLFAYDIIALFKNMDTQLITNCKLEKEQLHKLEQSGLKRLITSYKNDYKSKILKISYKTTKIFNNRCIFNTSPVKNLCYIPFYKMYISPLGIYNYCNNDFSEQGAQMSVYSITPIEWFNSDPLNRFRKLLVLGRKNKCCKVCDCQGVLYGEDYYRQYKDKIK